MVYRSHSNLLWSSVREEGASTWSDVVLSPVPDDNSNINAGSLPDGTAFIVSNAVPHRPRNPLTLALAPDGLNFTCIRVLQTCHPGFSANSTCQTRGAGRRDGGGPSYPQALTVVAPAPSLLHGFWVVATNNKEDVVVTQFPWFALQQACT